MGVTDSTATETTAVGLRDPATAGRLGEVLVHLETVSPQTVQKALKLQSELTGRLGTNLLELGAINEATLLAILGRQRSTRTAAGTDLRTAPTAVVNMIPAKLARRYHLVPFRLRRKTLWIASTDPIDALIEDEISLLTGCMVKSCIGLEVRIFEALETYYQVPNPVRTSALARRLNAASRPQESAEASAETDEAAAATTAEPGPSVRARRPAGGAEAGPARRPPQAATAPRREYPSFIELDAEDQALLRLSGGEPETAVEAAAREAAALEAAAREAKARVEAARKAAAEAATREAEAEAAAREAEAQAAAREAREAAAREAAAREAEALEAAARETEAREVETREIQAREAREAAAREAEAETEPEDIEDRLHRAAQAFQHAEIRDEIADVLLDFCAPYFKRRMLLIRRRDLIVGWHGEGEGVVPDMVRGIWIHNKEPSVFLSVSSSGYWLGPLPPLPPNQNLVLGLGGERPKDCVVLPITLMSKIVCYLYGDNMGESVAGSPIAELRRLAAKAAVAFEVYILKNKIRML